MKQEKVQRDIKEDKTQCMVRENRHFMFAILIPYFLFVFTKCLNTCLFHYDQIRWLFGKWNNFSNTDSFKLHQATLKLCVALNFTHEQSVVITKFSRQTKQ